jgi:hypothetical protein
LKWSKTKCGVKAAEVKSYKAKIDGGSRNKWVPNHLSNISKMPMQKSSFSSHLIKTVFCQSFSLSLEKKKEGWGG